MQTATEGQLQRSIIAWLRAVLPDALVHHSPNEGVRGGKVGILDGARKKAAGQLAGWPDIEVMTWANIGPMFFEVKTDVGVVSKTQAAVLERLRTFGYRVAVVHSIEDVRACLFEWGIATTERGSTVRLNVRGQIT
jgi:hypothetical protein